MPIKPSYPRKGIQVISFWMALFIWITLGLRHLLLAWLYQLPAGTARIAYFRFETFPWDGALCIWDRRRSRHPHKARLLSPLIEVLTGWTRRDQCDLFQFWWSDGLALYLTRKRRKSWTLCNWNPWVADTCDGYVPKNRIPQHMWLRYISYIYLQFTSC